MSSERESLILTFRTTHDALRGEAALKSAGLAGELIPVPRQIASDCGFCLLLDRPERDAEATVPVAEKTEIESVWIVAAASAPGGKNKEKRYERIA